MPATHIRVSVRWRGFIVTEPLPRISFRHADGSIATQFDYTKHYSRSHDAVICVYDAAGNVIETHEHKRDFKEPCVRWCQSLHLSECLRSGVSEVVAFCADVFLADPQ